MNQVLGRSVSALFAASLLACSASTTTTDGTAATGADASAVGDPTSPDTTAVVAQCIVSCMEARARNCEIDELTITSDCRTDCSLYARTASKAGNACFTKCEQYTQCELTADLCAVPPCQVPTLRACLTCMTEFCVETPGDPDCKQLGF